MTTTPKEPDVQAGIQFWASKKASLETVLGGYDKGVRAPILVVCITVLNLAYRVYLASMP